MVKIRHTIGALGVASGALLVLPASPASAQQATDYQASLDQLNGSGASGTAMIQVSGNQATVTVDITGESAGAPHAQHVHIGGQGVCPTAAEDTDGDGLVSVPEGQPKYGEINVSLTTSGDVSPESALAVDRMPTAGSDGHVTYERTFDLPSGVTAESLANGVVVSHGYAGSSLGTDPSAYDGPDSPLMAGVPQEATLPVACGTLTAMPAGGVQTGGGGLASSDTGTGWTPYVLVGVGVAALGAAALGVTRRGDATS